MEEVTNALRRTRNGKAAGVDEVGPDLLKADIEMTASTLIGLYNKMWNAEKWPALRRKGLTVKTFKKGSRLECNNWRGVTLLPGYQV